MPSFFCTVGGGIKPGLRLDCYIAYYLKILSRSQIKAKKLKARLNGKDVKISRPLRGGEHLELFWIEDEPSFLVPQNIPLDVVYEDKRVIVINKKQGMVVHPGAGNRQGTLANALLYRMLNKEGGNHAGTDGYRTETNGYRTETDNGVLPLPCNVPLLGMRPGIVHRLDKDTSGLIISAWDDEALAFLSEQFKARKVRKSYAALVLGCPGDAQGKIEKNIIRSKKNRKTFTVSETGGRPSLTYYKIIRTCGDYSLLLLKPKTGRTHQLRVHLKYLGCPILGDTVYGRQDSGFPSATLMLHAKNLSLVLPGKCKAETFKTALPQRFKNILKII